MIPLLPNGHAKLVHAAELAQLPRPELLRWCYTHARYTIVTQELVLWLRDLIAGRRAIEVGAGQGDLGYHLGIPMTDSAIQQADPWLTVIGLMRGHALTDPPPDVERLDSSAAVAHYKPQVVVASWLTQQWIVGDDEAGIASYPHGSDELAIIAAVETYILIGNEAIHRTKRALGLPHETYAFPWLWSRSQRPELNRIWVWNRGD